MIVIKHFLSDRDGKTPNWKAAEDWLNNIFINAEHLGQAMQSPTEFRARLIETKAYPSGPSHNLILIVEDGIPEGKKV